MCLCTSDQRAVRLNLKNACTESGGVGLCVRQLDFTQPPSCHVQVVNPRPADARTSSLHQHEPCRDDQRPSINSKHGDEMENLKTLDSQGVLEFFCLVGLFSNPHQAPQPKQLQHHLAKDDQQHKHQHQFKGLHQQCQLPHSSQ